ncbi:hypothetical protein [Marinifilum fragile]|uniref:hypothetical protein n=1 Tax=Marinifilum fragile TaxID=570161 RepID=UPI0012FBC456|nr:hypothetical protein [Marinifilum fragile]
MLSRDPSLRASIQDDQNIGVLSRVCSHPDPEWSGSGSKAGYCHLEVLRDLILKEIDPSLRSG